MKLAANFAMATPLLLSGPTHTFNFNFSVLVVQTNASLEQQPLSHKTMGLGILDPRGHPDSDPILRVPGTHVLWNTDVQTKDSHHIVLIPTVNNSPAKTTLQMNEIWLITSSQRRILMILSIGLSGRKKSSFQSYVLLQSSLPRTVLGLGFG